MCTCVVSSSSRNNASNPSSGRARLAATLRRRRQFRAYTSCLRPPAEDWDAILSYNKYSPDALLPKLAAVYKSLRAPRNPAACARSVPASAADVAAYCIPARRYTLLPHFHHSCLSPHPRATKSIISLPSTSPFPDPFDFFPASSRYIRVCVCQSTYTHARLRRGLLTLEHVSHSPCPMYRRFSVKSYLNFIRLCRTQDIGWGEGYVQRDSVKRRRTTNV